mgnify:CR=1 FL=1
MPSPASSPTCDTLAVRVLDRNEDHHLWNNRGTWWCHYTIHRADHTSERVRISLRTKDRLLARNRRDQLFTELQEGGSRR